MKIKLVLLWFVLLVFNLAYAQTPEKPVQVVDSLYKEDQFYAGLTYNILVNRPGGVSQTGFSLGLQAGFIKDMPLNKRRNLALGLGIGYSYNLFNQNLGVFEGPENDLSYIVLDASYELEYSRNSYFLHMVEVPFQIRWRTSTASDYRFWRIYTGFNVGYVFHSITKFKGEIGKERLRNTEGFNKLQYGLTLSAGYNTWNFYVYYPLNTLFEDANTFLTQEHIDMKSIKLGLIFYLL
ncbi:porin family protein [Formosa sp. S-31]|uniref:porin family protein n=1 Tax=Formosa sp. S-31 TaxID=2790949 RepID=UPI003EC144EE